MKHITKYIAATALMAGVAFGGHAQFTNSGYFLDNYTYRYQLNPAFGGEGIFFSIPAIGNLNVGMNGTLHLNSLLYNRDGRTVLFTTPLVSVNEAMSNLNGRKRLGTAEKIGILSGGFKAWGGYNTISINARVNADVSVPGSFFSLAKEGITNKTYNITDLNAYANAYVELALNHSRDIKQVPGLRVGAALKINVGIGALNMDFNEADLTLGEDAWTAKTNANIYAALGGLRFKEDTYTPKGTKDTTPRQYVSGVKVDSPSPTGFGLGFDLGAQYEWRDFKFSIAALDLGFMDWGQTKWASTDGTQEFTTDKYLFSANGDAANSFENELDNLVDDLAKLYQLKDMGEKNSFTRGLATTLNFGIDYTLPYYRKLHFGLMNSTRINNKFSWTEFRLSANVNPVKCFSADVNLGVGTFGASFGWMLNLKVPGFNFFLGMDHTPGKLAKQCIPLNSNVQFNFGMNIALK